MTEKEKSNSLRKTAKYYDELSATYDGTYSDPISQAENSFTQKRIGEVLRGDVLDVGSGTGLFLDLCTPAQAYLGLELSPQMTKKAVEKHPERHFVVGDMNRLPVASESYDTVVSMFGTFSYSITPEALVDEFWRVLRPGGKGSDNALKSQDENEVKAGGVSQYNAAGKCAKEVLHN